MNGLAKFTLADRFAAIIAWLLKAACTENNRRRSMDGPLTTALIFRVQRLRNRFAALYAKWKAGTLPVPGSARRRAGSARPADNPRPPSGPAASLPRTFAWLHRFVPESAPPAAGRMFPLFEDPEMLAFHAAAPQVGRILRPYCWMVGIRPPTWLALPKRKRMRRRDGGMPRASHPAACRSGLQAERNNENSPPSPSTAERVEGRSRIVSGAGITSVFLPPGPSAAHAIPDPALERPGFKNRS